MLTTTLLLLGLPFQLRPMTTQSSARAEASAAVFTDANGNVDIASTNVLSASYQLTEAWAPMLRLGFVGNNGPGAAHDGTSIANPVIGVTYTRTEWLSLFAGTTLPVGTGDDPAAAAANLAAMTARPADDMMFAVDDMIASVGADVAYVKHGFTAQAEATLQQNVRAFHTRVELGAHVGAFIGRHVSIGGDVLYQRSLTDPVDALTASFGVRAHFKSIHPGLSYTRGLDATGPTAGSMITNRTSAIAIDVPVMFD